VAKPSGPTKNLRSTSSDRLRLCRWVRDVRFAQPPVRFDLSQFERELQEHAAPSAAIQAIPLRMVL